MKVVIIGAGTVGYSLAEHLTRINHHVAIIDENASLCEEINSKLDVFTVTGHGTNPSVLKEAGITDADMLVAVTPHDDTNLVACNFAKQFGVPQRIARVKAGEYTSENSELSLNKLGVNHVIEPEKEVVQTILQYVEFPGVSESSNFQNDNVLLRGYKVTENMPVANLTLSQIQKLTHGASLLVVLLVRNNKSILPTGDEQVLPGDEIIAVMAKDALDAFRRLFDRPAEKSNKIIVSGDTLTSVRLAKELKNYADRVILIDPNREHGNYAASELNGIDVLYGNCTNVEVLQDAGIDNADFFIGSAEETEDNIISCVLAKAEGAKEVIAVSNTDKHMNLFQSLGLDHIINPRKITAQSIMANILKAPIGALLHIKHTDIEVSRFVAGKNSRIINKPLSQLTNVFRKSIIIGSIFRDDNVIIPSGDTKIYENDEIIVLYKPNEINRVNKLFREGMHLPF